MSEKTFDILVIGSGLSSLTFAEEYLKKKSKLHVISPTFKNKYTNKSKFKLDQKTLPPQLKKNFNHIEDYFSYNKFSFDKNNCNLLGSLESGGLSNYWGLQMDKDIGNDLDVFGKHTKQQIINSFLEILNEKSLTGSFKNYINDFKIDTYYEKFLSKKNTKNKNFLFLNGIDFIYQFFNLESKNEINIFSKSLKLLNRNKNFKKIFTKFADTGIVF